LHGAIEVAAGDRDTGLLQLRAALALGPRSDASAEALNMLACQLAEAGVSGAPRGIKVLQGAIMLYPDDANLYDSLADLSAAQGLMPQALAAYRKVLELRPDYPNAAAARAFIKCAGACT
jgi:tetratricopeptide (TPR) repeat protein